MKKLLTLISFLVVFKCSAQLDYLNSLSEQFCDSLEKIDNLEKMSNDEIYTLFNMSKKYNELEWDAQNAYYDSIQKRKSHYFDYYYRHILLQKCPTFRSIENKVFNDNPSIPFQAKQRLLAQQFIYMIEDREIDSAFITQLLGTNKNLDLHKSIQKMDSLITPIKQTTIIEVNYNSIPFIKQVEIFFKDFETKKILLLIGLDFDKNNLYQLKEIEIKTAIELQEEQESLKKQLEKDGIPPPPAPMR